MLTQKKELSILLMMKNRLMTLGISIALILSLILSGTVASVKAASSAASSAATSATSPTSTAIKNLVIIFQENVSFDHYFVTYPNATNPPREPKFTTDSHTPSVNELTPALLNNNPNGNYSMNPFRLDRSQAITCDMNHEYTAEQQAYHGGS